MKKRISSLVVGTLVATTAVTGTIAAEKAGKEAPTKEKAGKETPTKEKAGKETPTKEKAGKETPTKEKFPNSGHASPEGKTQKERDAFLHNQSRENPNSYKDTKEYKAASPEKQREVDAAVERNRRALEELRRQKQQ